MFDIFYIFPHLSVTNYYFFNCKLFMLFCFDNLMYDKLFRLWNKNSAYVLLMGKVTMSILFLYHLFAKLHIRI
jgi:hypothetical protein